MKKYEKVEIAFIFLEEHDVLTISENDGADDFGRWDSSWFSKSSN